MRMDANKSTTSAKAAVRPKPEAVPTDDSNSSGSTSCQTSPDAGGVDMPKLEVFDPVKDRKPLVYAQKTTICYHYISKTLQGKSKDSDGPSYRLPVPHSRDYHPGNVLSKNFQPYLQFCRQYTDRYKFEEIYKAAVETYEQEVTDFKEKYHKSQRRFEEDGQEHHVGTTWSLLIGLVQRYAERRYSDFYAFWDIYYPTRSEERLRDADPELLSEIFPDGIPSHQLTVEEFPAPPLPLDERLTKITKRQYVAYMVDELRKQILREEKVPGEPWLADELYTLPPKPNGLFPIEDLMHGKVDLPDCRQSVEMPMMHDPNVDARLLPQSTMEALEFIVMARYDQDSGETYVDDIELHFRKCVRDAVQQFKDAMTMYAKTGGRSPNGLWWSNSVYPKPFHPNITPLRASLHADPHREACKQASQVLDVLSKEEDVLSLREPWERVRPVYGMGNLPNQMVNIEGVCKNGAKLHIPFVITSSDAFNPGDTLLRAISMFSQIFPHEPPIGYKQVENIAKVLQNMRRKIAEDSRIAQAAAGPPSMCSHLANLMQ